MDLSGYPIAQQMQLEFARQNAQNEGVERQNSFDPLQLMQTGKRGLDVYNQSTGQGKGGGGKGLLGGGGGLMSVPGGSGYGTAAGGAAHSAGVQAVPDGLSNASVGKGASSGGKGAAGMAALPLAIFTGGMMLADYAKGNRDERMAREGRQPAKTPAERDAIAARRAALPIPDVSE